MKTLQQKYIDKYEHGDIEKIHKKSKLSRTTISNAIKYKTGSKKTINLIEKYYDTKKDT